MFSPGWQLQVFGCNNRQAQISLIFALEFSGCGAFGPSRQRYKHLKSALASVSQKSPIEEGLGDFQRPFLLPKLLAARPSLVETAMAENRLPHVTAQRRSVEHSWVLPWDNTKDGIELEPCPMRPWRPQPSCTVWKRWPFHKSVPAPAGPTPPSHTAFSLAGWLLSPEKVHNLNLSSFVSLMFSRIEKRKDREEYKEAIKDTLNKPCWEPVCVEERIWNVCNGHFRMSV